MNNLIPINFTDALGGLVVVLGLICGFVSLIPTIRTHAIKLLAIFLVAALSLFSNHWSTYFAGLFIIATAVTELEFLQNLAAIIRGNKDYFDYKKESLSTEEKKIKIIEEQEGISTKVRMMPSLSEVDQIELTKKRSPNIERILTIESKALDMLEEYFKTKIERSVSLSREGRRIELDGIIPETGVTKERIIEVKYIKDPGDILRIRKIFPLVENLAKTYSEITNRIAKLHIVLVVEGEKGFTEDQLTKIKKMIDLCNIGMDVSVFTTAQLGVQLVT
jgi:hypothetical protein